MSTSKLSSLCCLGVMGLCLLEFNPGHQARAETVPQFTIQTVPLPTIGGQPVFGALGLCINRSGVVGGTYFYASTLKTGIYTWNNGVGLRFLNSTDVPFNVYHCGFCIDSRNDTRSGSANLMCKRCFRQRGEYRFAAVRATLRMDDFGKLTRRAS